MKTRTRIRQSAPLLRKIATTIGTDENKAAEPFRVAEKRLDAWRYTSKRYLHKMWMVITSNSIRKVWCPIEEVHEDYGDVILISVTSDLPPIIAGVCDVLWNEESEGYTHFAKLPPLTIMEVEELREELEGKHNAIHG